MNQRVRPRPAKELLRAWNRFAASSVRKDKEEPTRVFLGRRMETYTERGVIDCPAASIPVVFNKV